MIQLILLIASMNQVDRIDPCATLSMNERVYVTTYKGIEYNGDYFYNRLCNDSLTREYILAIKRGY